MYSVNLYKDLLYNDNQCVYQVGGIEVAYTDARLRELHRKQSAAAAYGLEGHVISPQEVAGYPDSRSERDQGRLLRAHRQGRARLVLRGGAGRSCHGHRRRVCGNVHVTDLPVTTAASPASSPTRAPSRRPGAAGHQCVGRVLPDKLGLRFPLLGVEHQYAITEPLPELAADKDLFVKHPILRHQDFSLYFRQHGDAYGIGNYRHESLLFEGDYVGARAEREFTPEHLQVAATGRRGVAAALAGKGYVRKFNGFMAFSTDMGPIAGETDIPGLWSAWASG